MSTPTNLQIAFGIFEGAPTPADLQGWAHHFGVKPRQHNGFRWRVKAYGHEVEAVEHIQCLFKLYYKVHIEDGLTWADLAKFQCDHCKDQRPPENLVAYECCNRTTCNYCHATRWCGETMQMSREVGAL